MKKIFALALVLIMAAAVIACTPQQDPGGVVVDIIDQSPAPTDNSGSGAVALELAYPDGLGMVAAGALHTVALRTDGTVFATGHSLNGQCAVSTWTNITYIAASDTLTVGVTAQGGILMAGLINEQMQAAASWTDIVRVAVGAEHIVGLKSDGTAVAAGATAIGQCDVSSWNGLTDIAASGNHTVGLKKDGSVVAVGDNGKGQSDVSSWGGVVAIAAGPNHTVGLKSDGSVISTKNDTATLSGVKKLFAGADITIGITEAGAVVSAPANAELDAVTDAAWAAYGTVHGVIMKNDGTLVGVGNGDDLQLAFSNVHVRPYIEDGYVLGVNENFSASNAISLLGGVFGGTITFADASGAAVEGMAPVGTGLTVNKDGAAIGTLVILGDVDGDGGVSELDAATVASKTDLEGAALRASQILKSADSKLFAANAQRMQDAVAGVRPISQFGANVTPFDVKIAAMAETNNDVVGWIAIEGTNIDYPIFYDASGKWFYNDHDYKKDKSESASFYAYFSKYLQNNAFTAHNSRKSGTMFHQLHHIQEYNLGKTNCEAKDCGAALGAGLPDFKTYAGRVFTINFYGVESKWEIFSMYETKAGESADTLLNNTWYNWYLNDKTISEEDIAKWINKQVERSEYKFDTTVTPKDTFITTFTCGKEHVDANENARLYYFLKKVD